MKAILTVLISILCFISQSFSIGQEWVTRFNGSANSLDWGYTIALDNAGNIFVTGYTTGTGTGKDMRMIKYDSNGNMLWTQSYNGPINGGDYSFSIFIDPAGYSYITGRADFGAPLSDIITIKYSPTGNQEWVARYNGTSNNADEGKVVFVDAAGNVYVGGKTLVTGEGYNFIAIKYNSSGVEQWVSTYNGPGNNEDVVNSISSDNSGNVYLAGASIGSNTGSDFTIVKYNPDGTFGWVKRYNGPANGGDVALTVKCNAAGDIFTAGTADMGASNKYDFVIVKYNSSGAQQWISFYNGTGVFIDDFATAMEIDESSNIYVTGASGGFVGGRADSNYVTVKYNTDGVMQWSANYTGPNNSIDVTRSIYVDNSQNVYITGTSTGLLSDYVSIKYNSNGSTAWIMSYNGPSSQNDNGTSIAADENGNVYVTGRSFGAGTDYDYATIKYSNFVGINPVSNSIPDKFELYQNYPNPFNPSTKIKFGLPAKSNVELFIYNSIGEIIKKESLGTVSPGIYEYQFAASNLGSGVYFYTIRAGDNSITRKMMLVK